MCEVWWCNYSDCWKLMEQYLTSMAMKRDVIDKVNCTSFVLPFTGRLVISIAYAIIISWIFMITHFQTWQVKMELTMPYRLHVAQIFFLQFKNVFDKFLMHFDALVCKSYLHLSSIDYNFCTWKLCACVFYNVG